jgi:4-deoxy-L-threo-5-hexosulose-uronate ketol-isomerase
MISQMCYPPDPKGFSRMTTTEMRRAFLVTDLFVPGTIQARITGADRAVIGAAIPHSTPLVLESSRELAAEYFAERREIGVFNLGGEGHLTAGGVEVCLGTREGYYIGRGTRDITFRSSEPALPAQFYFVSYPAHREYPSVKIGKTEQTVSAAMGNLAAANRRTIHKIIHPSTVPTSQLTMGFTVLEEGSVWNTMPAHTHARRTEIYLYFDLPADGMVVHSMGEPHETRHLIVRDRQVVVSPSWSVHFGAGTSRYSFVWSMGGENQEFSDMDSISMDALL